MSAYCMFQIGHSGLYRGCASRGLYGGSLWLPVFYTLK
jgi:hypothetical protein